MRQVVEMKVGEDVYKLVYNINTLCDIEEASGKGFPLLAAEMSDPDKISITTARVILWAGLRTHHPKITIAQAGDIIAGAGGLLPVIEKISEAIGDDAGAAKVAA